MLAVCAYQYIRLGLNPAFFSFFWIALFFFFCEGPYTGIYGDILFK